MAVVLLQYVLYSLKVNEQNSQLVVAFYMSTFRKQAAGWSGKNLKVYSL